MKLDVDIAAYAPYTVVRLAGTIDEDFGGKALAAKIDGDAVVLDLGGITKISSFGIREWVDFGGNLRAPQIVLVECAPKVVDQINMVANFTGRGHVVSVYAPFRCDYCDSEHRVLLRVDRDADAIKAKKLAERPCPSCKQPMYFDDDGATFFSYLAAQPAFELDGALAAFLRAKMDYAGGERRLRIDKRVDGRVTFLQLSGDLDRAFRRDKLAEGLEGTVIADVTALGAIDPAGAAEWRALVRDVAPAIDVLLIAGASAEFVERLCDRESLGGKAIVLSIALPYRCAACDTTAPQSIEIALHHDVLRFATAPELRCGKCNGVLACVATEGAMAALPSLRLPTTEDRATYLRAKSSPPPRLRVVAAPRQSHALLMLGVFGGIVAISLGLLWATVWRHGDAHAPSNEPPPPVAKVPIVERPDWIAAPDTCRTTVSGGFGCVAASYPAATSDDAGAEAMDAVLDTLAIDVGARVTDARWRDVVRPRYASPRAAKLAAAERDPSARREVREIRRAVAAMMRAHESIATEAATTRFDDHQDAGVVGFVRAEVPSQVVLQLADQLARADAKLGATAMVAFPALAWSIPHLDHGLVVVAIDAGPLHDLGLAVGDVVTAFDGKPAEGLDDLAAAADTYAKRVKTGGTFRVQVLAPDGTTRELIAQLPAPRGGSGGPPAVPTGGINVWDRTSGRDDPNK